MEALLECSNLVKTFEADSPVTPLDGVSLSVHAGELVAIRGVSGKGKSTLLNVVGGLLRPTAGSVRYRGEDLSCAGGARLDAVHRCGIGFIFQSPCLFQALTARENLLFSQGVCKGRAIPAQVDAALEEFGLAERADHLPSELSVGQKRRLMVARAFLADHDLILADEPTNDLDQYWSDFVFHQFRQFADSGERAVVLVTHDDAYASRADTIYALDRGKLTLEKGGAHVEP